MKQLLALSAACLLCLPVAAQMDHSQMPDMPGMHHAPAPQKTPATRPAAPAPQQPALHAEPAHRPAMPFGKVADGDTSLEPRPVPAVTAPVQLGTEVQEQEHPDRRSGSDGIAMPDLLADVKGNAPQALEFFTQKAMNANPTLRQAELQVRRLRAEAKQAGLWSNPEIGYEADHIRGGIYHSGEQGGYVQQAIPLGGQQSSARAAVTAQAQQAERVLQAQQERVRSAVAQAFYAALATQREVDLRTELAALAVDSTTGIHQLANIGQADAPDLLQSEVEREQAKLELAMAQRSYRKAFAALAAVSGDGSIPVSPLTGDLAAVPQLQNTAASLAESSPTLQVAQQQIVASDAAVRSAQRQQRPQLILHAGLQQDNEPLESTGGRVGVVGIAQAGITLPLWNRNQGVVQAARAERASAEADVARTRLSLQMQAEQTLQDYGNAMVMVAAYRSELLPRAERSYTLYQAKYAQMAAAFPQLVLSHRTLLQLQVEYTRVLASAWQSALLLQHGLLTDGLAAPERLGSSQLSSQPGVGMR